MTVTLIDVRDWHLEEVRRLNNSQHPFPNNSTVLDALVVFHQSMADAIDAHIAGMGEPVRFGICSRCDQLIPLAAPPASGDWDKVREVIEDLRREAGLLAHDLDSQTYLLDRADKLEAALAGKP